MGVRMSSMATWPPTSSPTPGTTLMSRPACWARSDSSRMRLAEALGSATSRVSAWCSMAASAIRVRSPMTRTPMIRRWRLVGSSSRRATGR